MISEQYRLEEDFGVSIDEDNEMERKDIMFEYECHNRRKRTQNITQEEHDSDGLVPSPESERKKESTTENKKNDGDNRLQERLDSNKSRDDNSGNNGTSQNKKINNSAKDGDVNDDDANNNKEKENDDKKDNDNDDNENVKGDHMEVIKKGPPKTVKSERTLTGNESSMQVKTRAKSSYQEDKDDDNRTVSSTTSSGRKRKNDSNGQGSKVIDSVYQDRTVSKRSKRFCKATKTDNDPSSIFHTDNDNDVAVSLSEVGNNDNNKVHADLVTIPSSSIVSEPNKRRNSMVNGSTKKQRIYEASSIAEIEAKQNEAALTRDDVGPQEKIEKTTAYTIAIANTLTGLENRFKELNNDISKLIFDAINQDGWQVEVLTTRKLQYLGNVQSVDFGVEREKKMLDWLIEYHNLRAEINKRKNPTQLHGNIIDNALLDQTAHAMPSKELIQHLQSHEYHDDSDISGLISMLSGNKKICTYILEEHNADKNWRPSACFIVSLLLTYLSNKSLDSQEFIVLGGTCPRSYSAGTILFPESL